jgi:hypothetical protein
MGLSTEDFPADHITHCGQSSYDKSHYALPSLRSNVMTDDQLREWASKVSSEIVKREGAALALSACDRDESAIEADSNLLGIAIAQAVIEAYRAGVGSALRRNEARGAR